MCGIAGIAGPWTDWQALERMAEAMADRGPDGQGVWLGEQISLSLRRLAIIDLDERSNQPMHFGRFHLVFNGEVYNYLELREELSGLGHTFATEGDAEVLLHAWAQWDEGALTRLNGMFAFGIWDEERRRLTLATDRFGEKPLLFTENSATVLFASDIRALRAADPSIGLVDERAVRDFLTFGLMPEFPSTFFNDVRRLPPSHIALWEPGGPVAARRYWTPAIVDVPRDPTLAARRLRDLLSDSVRLRLRSDVAVGTSLSGGVDSAGIVTLVSRLADDQDRHAFTAAFAGFERDEWAYAEAAASAAGVGVHHAIRPTSDELLDDLSALVCDQEEPFPSTSIYAQWRVMQAARETGVIVLLDGQGADELFGGYAGIAGWVLRSLGPGAVIRGVAADPAVTGEVLAAYLAGRAPRRLVHRHRLRRASPYVARELAIAASDEAEFASDWLSGGPPLRQELARQAFRTSLPHLCRYVDRNSMAHSVEARLPFLDPRVAEFALSLPPNLVLRNGETKQVLRDALRGLVPDAILNRRDKVGYETPEESWFAAKPLRLRCAEILLDPASVAAGRYDCRAIEKDIARGEWRDVGALWRAANIELWLAASNPSGVRAAVTSP
jgi:asparagine synthase (glutamine-hydrolysing)